jgi:hypothetical protein
VQVRVRREAIRQHRAADALAQRHQHGVVVTQHGKTVERQALQELDEGAVQALRIAAVGVHVVEVDVGDHRQDRVQMQEGRVRLVGFHHQIAPGAQTRAGTERVDPPADDEGRIEPALPQHVRDEAGGGGLAVRAGNGDAVFEAHQLGQHGGARHHRHAARTGGSDLHVVRRHSGRHYHHVRAVDVGSRVALLHLRAQRFQP